MMATSEATELQRERVDQAVPAARQNSPIVYGLGSFGLESTYKVFWGFYVFFNVAQIICKGDKKPFVTTVP
jgi:hypothetical protein